MALTAEERRAAAAARRQKVLGRGDSRMAQVTGTLAKPNDVAGMFLGQTYFSQRNIRS